jgi:magnesium-protoporphyrin O-methyltransferase
MSGPTCDCCPPERDPTGQARIVGHFDEWTRKNTADGALPEMVAISEQLFAQLNDVAAARPTVLELGCGTGALLVALLSAGAASAVGVDLSPEALAAARRRADEAGVAERATFQQGDGARVQVTPHDLVVLDRAICCYPDMPSLVGNAIGAARSRVAFSVPTSRGARGLLNRLFWGFEAWLTRTPLGRGACPGFVHSLDAIEGKLSAAGFTRRSCRTDWLWYTAVWERA